MKDENKTKKRLLNDMKELRQRIAQLESHEYAHKQMLQILISAENAVRTCPTGIVTINQDGYLTYVNPFLLKTWGYNDRNEILGNCLSSLFRDREKTKKLIPKMLSGKVAKDLELVGERKDGSHFLTELKTSLITYSERKSLGATVSIADITDRKDKQITACSEQMARSTEGTIQAIASIAEMHDPYTAGHQKRVAQLACAIAEAQGLNQDQINSIRIAGYLHDVGKICIPTDILSKPGRLNDTEFGMIKHHVNVGYQILKPIEFPWPIAKIVFQHHERLNGSGYPQKLHGKDILLESKILAVADVVEAISSHRPYRPSLGMQAALEEISNNKSVLYDADVVDVCTRVVNVSGFQFEYN